MKLLVNKLSAALALAMMSTLAHAYVDCTRPISRVFSGHDPYKIYVDYNDGFAAAGTQLVDVDSDQQAINRTLTIILAAHLAQRPVTFRYASGIDGSPASCTPTVTQRLIGAWAN